MRVPIIGDFHYNGHILLKKYPECARALAKYRINPGNSDIGRKNDDNFRTMIEVAVENDKPVRIGVNWGSLDAALLTRMMDENSPLPEPKDAREVTLDAMVASAVQSAQAAERHGLGHDQIILSAKVSGVQDLIDVYRALAAVCDYPLHLGLTEAGMGSKGIVATTAALSVRCCRKASATPSALRSRRMPNGDRTEEVIVSQQILQSLGIRSFTPQVTACPGCGRTTSTFFQEMADQIQTYLREQMPKWKAGHPGRGDHEGGGDGLRGERSGRIQALQYRDLAAGHVRRAESAGLCGRPADDHAEGRPHRGRVHRHSEQLRDYALRVN